MQSTHSSRSSQGLAFSSTDQGATPRLPDITRKLVIVGDGGCGKTCLLFVFAKEEFPEEYVPTVFETYAVQIPREGKLIELTLWDTAGQEEYDRLRPLSYNQADIVLICFAINYPVSLENIQDKWHPEVEHFCPDATVYLIGNKVDLRKSKREIEMLGAQGKKPVTYEEGSAVAKAIGAHYAECSAKTRFGVQELFDAALDKNLQGKKGSKLKKKLNCVIL